MDKLQTELGSHRDKLEEASRLQIRLREMKAKSEQVLEAKAMLEDEVESLQDKVATLGEWVAVSDLTCKLILFFFLLG